MKKYIEPSIEVIELEMENCILNESANSIAAYDKECDGEWMSRENEGHESLW